MRPPKLAPLLLLLAAPALAGPEARTEGCTVERAATDARGIATYRSLCRWSVGHELVARALGDKQLMEASNANLGKGRTLPDGRSINVHTHLGIADRQSTLEGEREALPGGGLRLRYWSSPRQAPLEPGRVQVLVDEGVWEILPDGAGGTQLRYEMRYDPGGNLRPWLVRRFQAAGIASSLDALRRAAESLAARATPDVAAGPPTAN